MGLDPDGDTEPLGQRHTRLEHPGRGPELLLAFRLVSGQRTAEHADQRGFPVTGQFEEPAQLGAWIVTGQADGTVHRYDRQAGRDNSPPDLGAAGAGIRGSMSSPSMSRSSTPA